MTNIKDKQKYISDLIKACTSAINCGLDIQKAGDILSEFHSETLSPEEMVHIISEASKQSMWN